MHILGNCWCNRIQAHIAPFGPISTTCFGVAAQAGTSGRHMDVLGQGDHGCINRHFGKIRHGAIVTVTILEAKNICLGFVIYIGNRYRVIGVTNKFTLVGVIMAHQTINIIDIRGMWGIAVSPNVATKAGTGRRHGIGAEGVNTTNRFTEILTIGIG